MILTVEQLRTALASLEADLPVLLEGCDCVGFAYVALADRWDDGPETKTRVCFLARDTGAAGEHRFLEEVAWIVRE